MLKSTGSTTSCGRRSRWGPRSTAAHLLCPSCNHDDSRVIDSRDSGDGIRRRRECTKCGRRFTTYERIQTRVLLVRKSDGRQEEFDRDKLWSSVTKACVKRPLPTGTIEKIVQEIESALSDSGRAEVPSRAIGEMVIERLKKLDAVAYIRFASVYRDFRDIERFKDEIEAILEPEAEPEESGSSQLSFLEDEEVMPAPRRRRGRPRRQPE